jgi:multicomponent Na+:H+ antiporter subunit B
VNSVILKTAARLVVPLQLLFSAFLLVRGHNEPGGGFIGGLVAVAAIGLHALANGVSSSQRLLKIDPLQLAGAGLFVAGGSGLIAVFTGLPFMTGLWDGSVPTLVAGALKLGTPVLFDLGVYLVVVGAGVTLIYSLLEEND